MMECLLLIMQKSLRSEMIPKKRCIKSFRRFADLFAVVPQCGTKENQSVFICVNRWLKMVLNCVDQSKLAKISG